MGQAFDQAWAAIEAHFGDDPVLKDGARLSLANALLSVADETSRDVQVLKNAALQVIALTYKSLPIIRTPTVSN